MAVDTGWAALRTDTHTRQHARGVTTDSGGVTEETTVMGVPCVTLRGTTERPETVSIEPCSLRLPPVSSS